MGTVEWRIEVRMANVFCFDDADGERASLLNLTDDDDDDGYDEVDDTTCELEKGKDFKSDGLEPNPWIWFKVGPSMS